MNKPDSALLEQLLKDALPASPATLPEFFTEQSPFSAPQRAFLNGLFAGFSARSETPAVATAPQTPLTILFASQTGTAEALAKQLRKFAGGAGYVATIAELNSYTLDELAKVQHLLLIAATCGEGEPPDNAYNFYQSLNATDAPSLPASLHYSVCGLGDSSYAHFNKVARTIDEQLASLGATRVAPLMPCDVDYEAEHEHWRDAVFGSDEFVAAAGAGTTAVAEPEPEAATYDKHRPFMATLMASECLSAQCSAKRINHIEIALTGADDSLNFEPGDALGLWALNDMEDVDAILHLTGFSGTTTVQLKNGPAPLRQALYRCLDLNTVTGKSAELWGAELANDDQLADVLSTSPEQLTPQLLVDGLRPLQPRLYSIASSLKQHPGEVHLTVGEVHYEHHGKQCHGVASNFLGSRLSIGSALGVYVQKTAHFGLPEDDSRPIIMIGPGTGVAPFRAFLEERQARQAPGANWLFFGDQHESSDYLYRQQISAWQENGLLSRLSLAWSRDNEKKVYVQHLIEQDGATFFEWLEAGAAIYICGDAAHMAPDVEQAILRVIATHGQYDLAGATDYLDQLRDTQRYQRDVY